MDTDPLPSRPVAPLRRYLPWIAGVVTAIVGGTLAWGVARRSDTRMRVHLLENATLIANSISVQDVKTLSFTPEDRDNPAFARLGAWMKGQRDVVGCRSVYSTIQRGPEIVFGPESLDPTDRFASPPGTAYREPPPVLVGVFSSRRPATVGPYADEYGTFVSAFAPVMDRESGALVLVVGMDVVASDWKTNVARDAAVPLLLAALVILLLVLLQTTSLLRWRGATLRESEQRCQALYENSMDGIIMMDWSGGIVAANPAAQRLLGRSAEGICAAGLAGLGGKSARLEEFVTRLGREGQARGELSLLRGDGQFVQVEASSKQFKDCGGSAMAAVILRDITERKAWERERDKLISELTAVGSNVKSLSGLLPICAHCKKIRNDGGDWEQLEVFITERSSAHFSHSVCPDCMSKYYPGQPIVRETGK